MVLGWDSHEYFFWRTFVDINFSKLDRNPYVFNILRIFLGETKGGSGVIIGTRACIVLAVRGMAEARTWDGSGRALPQTSVYRGCIGWSSSCLDNEACELMCSRASTIRLFPLHVPSLEGSVLSFFGGFDSPHWLWYRALFFGVACQYLSFSYLQNISKS